GAGDTSVNQVRRPIRSAALLLLAGLAVIVVLRQLLVHDVADLVGRLWVQAMSVVVGMLAVFFAH
ncbi:MAG TPA: hypothetical protein VG900_15560, partial [Hyphomicrobiaceae bacterium]|nr:hypothetical protein [Hyphomicrobiaceae bacterium]